MTFFNRHKSHSPGNAVRNVMKKKLAQPMDSTRYPDVGEIKILPNAARDDSSAYCVAVNRWLHIAMRSDTNAAVPMPPARFSKATAKISIP